MRITHNFLCSRFWSSLFCCGSFCLHRLCCFLHLFVFYFFCGCSRSLF
nr:MAG TPA: hypothetical protein [Caudoviricetes sp.]